LSFAGAPEIPGGGSAINRSVSLRIRRGSAVLISAFEIWKNVMERVQKLDGPYRSIGVGPGDELQGAGRCN
jgi:hypothetical protein